MFFLYPQDSKEPDPRCIMRMIKALRNPQNPHKSFIPTPVLTMLNSITDDHPTIRSIVLSWWRFNRKTEFFPCRRLAKILRSAVRFNPLDQ